jgi:hypothetical protein
MLPIASIISPFLFGDGSMDTLKCVCTLLAAVALVLSLGCAGQRQVFQPAEPLRLHDVAYPDIMQAAEETLGGMHFAIEKLDAEQGIIRTEPLRGAQFFEFWRSDNVGLHNTAEANLHTIRRAVELRIEQEEGYVRVDCHVRIQRLSLPENEAASISQAYQMHSRSTAAVQRLELRPQQRQGMAWIDLGPDPQLAAEILNRIRQRLRRGN